MNDSLDTDLQDSLHRRSFLGLVALATLAPERNDSSRPNSSDNQPDLRMKQFVIIFRQAPRQFTAADLKKRTEETRTWALPLDTAGHKLDPRILDPESHFLSDTEGGVAPASTAGPITALLFLEAQDFAQALELARTHPAIRYGASIEVRLWAPPTAQP